MRTRIGPRALLGSLGFGAAAAFRALAANPITAKEMRTRVRGVRALFFITLYMAVMGAVTIVYLVHQAQPTSGQQSIIGTQMFQVLALFQLLLIVFLVPAGAADAISGEHQRKTWELLLVTRASSLAMVWGKLVASTAFAGLLIFASLPFFSLAYLFGTLTWRDAFRVAVVLVATAVFLGAISLLISQLSQRVSTSIILGNLVAVALVGIAVLALYLDNQTRPQATSSLHPPSYPALTPLAQLDPFTALGSALPDGSGGRFLGDDVARIHHVFHLPWTLHLWSIYAIAATAMSVVFLAVTAWFIRHRPRWLALEVPA